MTGSIMAASITEVSGKIRFIDQTEIRFNSLVDMVEILRRNMKQKPSYVFLYAMSADGKTFQIGLDFNMFSETQIDSSQISFRKFQKMLGEMLLEKGLISAGQLDQAIEKQKKSSYHERIGEVLVRMGFVTIDQIIAVLDEQLGIEQT
jgi:hypothetical protein